MNNKGTNACTIRNFTLKKRCLRVLCALILHLLTTSGYMYWFGRGYLHFFNEILVGLSVLVYIKLKLLVSVLFYPLKLHVWIMIKSCDENNIFVPYSGNRNESDPKQHVGQRVGRQCRRRVGFVLFKNLLNLLITLRNMRAIVKLCHIGAENKQFLCSTLSTPFCFLNSAQFP